MSCAARSDLIELEVQLHRETEKAILISLDGFRDGAVWLPKSVVEFEVLSGTVILVTLSERLAIERGLV